jgi:hypothetical protein
MTHKANANDAVAPGVGMGAGQGVVVPAPSFHAEFEQLRRIDGKIVTVDRWPWDNVVVDVGKGQILNRLFGSITKSTAGCFLQLHSATTASNHVWSQISASQVISYGNNVPQITFNTNYAVGSASATASYGFTASTQTVSGACVQFYTTNTMSSNAATVDILQYSEGQFANSRQVIANDTLNVSLTVSYA